MEDKDVPPRKQQKRIDQQTEWVKTGGRMGRPIIPTADELEKLRPKGWKRFRSKAEKQRYIENHCGECGQALKKGKCPHCE